MIAYVGLSHLGLVYSLATAAKGFEVVGFDPRVPLCEGLNTGQFPISEPGLKELYEATRSRIRFSSNLTELAGCELIFLSLDVATDEANRSNLKPLQELAEQVVKFASPSATLVVLCQVPPGFTRGLRKSLGGGAEGIGSNLYYQVETLVFGSAVDRAMHPERIIVGCDDARAPLPPHYAKWLQAFGCPVLTMRYESAELAKIAINMFLVSTVTTTNVLAEICEKTGADWSEITPALRLDKRIGPHAYLSPGLGLAGGNLERDLITAQNLSAQFGTEASAVEAWQADSRYRRDWVLRKFHTLVAAGTEKPRVAIWGLAYKPNTHSIKNSPSVALIESLAPFTKVAFDPQVKLESGRFLNLEVVHSALDACRQANVLIIMTAWPEFANIDLAELKGVMAGNLVIDPFGALPGLACARAGFSHHRLGSPAAR